MALKAEISSRVSEILQDPQNASSMGSVLQKMGKLLAKKKSLQSDVPVKVFDNLWIGNYHFANCRSFLEQNGIQNIVSCLEFDLNLHLPHINYLKIALKDGQDERFEQAVFTFCRFMRNNLGKVYLHWYAVNLVSFSGQSRSSALLLSYIISSQKQNFPQALQSLSSVYPKAKPNCYFLTVLSGIAPKLLTFSLKQAPESKGESINLLDHIEQVISSPKKQDSKSLLPQLQNEANLLEFETAPQATGNQNLIAVDVEAKINQTEPLLSFDEHQQSYSKQQAPEVAQNPYETQLQGIDLSPKKQAAEPISLLTQNFDLNQQSSSKEVKDFSNDLLDLGQQTNPLKQTVQLQAQTKIDLESNGTNIKSQGQEQLIFLPLTVEKNQIQDIANMEVQVIQEPSFGSSFMDSKVQTISKQEEVTIAGEKEEQFAESNNFTQKKVKNKKKKR